MFRYAANALLEHFDRSPGTVGIGAVHTSIDKGHAHVAVAHVGKLLYRLVLLQIKENPTDQKLNEKP